MALHKFFPFQAHGRISLLQSPSNHTLLPYCIPNLHFAHFLVLSA